MPPKRPPPLPRSLFTTGPLSPGFAPAPPSPSAVHPEYITDAHTFGTHLDVSSAGLKASPSVRAAVVVAVKGVKPDGEPEVASRVSKVVTANAAVVSDECDSDSQNDAQTHEAAADLVIPNTNLLQEKQWDRLDEIINKIDGGWKKVEQEVAELGSAPRKILISGLLPPPLTKSPSPLLQDEAYHMHCGRLAQLSLHADVVLKALPPIVDKRIAGSNAWWEDGAELEHVIKMYLAPAIETFGSHRIVFGSAPALPPTDPEVIVPVSGAAWYALLRKCIAELGEDQESMTKIIGANAFGLYGFN